MTKRALCIGINDYPVPDADLKGCVNDAKAWAKLLVDHFDFPKTDVALLLDKKATKVNIVKGIKALLAGAKRGDVLVLANSGHGTYVADRSGDEPAYDEAMCPYDIRDNLIVDDELRELFAGLARGVRLTVLSDSCHSGSVTRAVPPEFTPNDSRPRFIAPSRVGRRGMAADKLRRAKSKHKTTFPESEMGEVLLSGCRSDQFSFDARFGNKHFGAMSFTALGIIAAAKHKITYAELHKQLVPALVAANFDQEPQLEGKSANKKRQIFT